MGAVLLSLSGPTLKQQPSLSHHAGGAVAGCTYMQLWLTNRISFESYSARKSWGLHWRPPANEGLIKKAKNEKIK